MTETTDRLYYHSTEWQRQHTGCITTQLSDRENRQAVLLPLNWVTETTDRLYYHSTEWQRKQTGCIITTQLSDMYWAGDHCTNHFSIVNQIPWKLGFHVIPLQVIISLQNIAQATTAQLSCHVQNFVMIVLAQSGQQYMEFFIEFWLRCKKYYWNSPNGPLAHYDIAKRYSQLSWQ